MGKFWLDALYSDKHFPGSEYIQSWGQCGNPKTFLTLMDRKSNGGDTNKAKLANQRCWSVNAEIWQGCIKKLSGKSDWFDLREGEGRQTKDQGRKRVQAECGDRRHER